MFDSGLKGALSPLLMCFGLRAVASARAPVKGSPALWRRPNQLVENQDRGERERAELGAIRRGR